MLQSLKLLEQQNDPDPPDGATGGGVGDFVGGSVGDLVGVLVGNEDVGVLKGAVVTGAFVGFSVGSVATGDFVGFLVIGRSVGGEVIGVVGVDPSATLLSQKSGTPKGY
jgi:hypothetical protein